MELLATGKNIKLRLPDNIADVLFVLRLFAYPVSSLSSSSLFPSNAVGICTRLHQMGSNL